MFSTSYPPVGPAGNFLGRKVIFYRSNQIPVQSAKSQISAMSKALLFLELFSTNHKLFSQPQNVVSDVALDCIAGVLYPMNSKHMACLL